MLLYGLEVSIRERVAGLEVTRGTQRKRGLREPDVAACGHRIQNLHGLGDDLDTDAITGDDG